MVNIWFDLASKKHYTNDIVFCNNCKLVINKYELFKLISKEQKQKVSVEYYHMSCKCKETGLISCKQEIYVITCNIIPKESILRVFQKADLKAGILTVFDAVDTTNDKYIGDGTSNYKEEDKTRLSNRESWPGVQIGNQQAVKQIIEENDKELSVDEGLALIDNIAHGEKLLPENNIINLRKKT